MLLGKKAIGTVAYLGGLPAVLSSFPWCWGQMIQYNAEYLADDQHYVHQDRATFSDHGPARNSLVNRFLGDWLLQLDTDHEFDPDLTGRMLRIADEYDVDVLSGFYQLKQPPHLPVLFQWVKINDKGDVGLQPMAVWPKELAIIEIGSAGAGCLFVRRRVFDRIANELKEAPFSHRNGYSEDHSFFDRCRQLGIKCYAALNVHFNHIRPQVVTPADFDPAELPAGSISELFPVGGCT